MEEITESSGVTPSADSWNRWYLLLTKPRGEEAAKEHLERQGYVVYYPRLRDRKMGRRGWRNCVSALFPRYLFLRVNNGQQSLGPARSTVGVADIVRFGSEYANVPPGIVQELIAREDANTGLHELKSPRFLPGAAVRVVAGAFAGLEGIFERELANDRVIVLFGLLGREAPVQVSMQHVAAR